MGRAGAEVGIGAAQAAVVEQPGPAQPVTGQQGVGLGDLDLAPEQEGAPGGPGARECGSSRPAKAPAARPGRLERSRASAGQAPRSRGPRPRRARPPGPGPDRAQLGDGVAGPEQPARLPELGVRPETSTTSSPAGGRRPGPRRRPGSASRPGRPAATRHGRPGSRRRRRTAAPGRAARAAARRRPGQARHASRRRRRVGPPPPVVVDGHDRRAPGGDDLARLGPVLEQLVGELTRVVAKLPGAERPSSASRRKPAWRIPKLIRPSACMSWFRWTRRSRSTWAMASTRKRAAMSTSRPSSTP